MAHMDGAGRFSVSMPLCKVWEDEAGELRFEGVASSTSLDRQQERMTPAAIRKMATQRGLDLLPSHSAGPLEELGVVEETWADNDRFRVAGRLDKTSAAARRLFARVMDGHRYGLSVGGRVTKAFWRYDPEAGREVRHIDDVELDHVAVCRPGAAANPDTYLAILAKAAEGVIAEEGNDEEAVLARVGRAAVNAARALWPFAKTEQGGETLERELAELSRLREEVAAALGEVQAALAELRKSAEAEESAVAAGVSRALPGQEGTRREGMWARVV
ncbi:MAG: hypothetical protein AB7Y46_05245 [Armatimonadota bacterium]